MFLRSMSVCLRRSKALQFDRADVGAVLFFVAAALCLLVVIELAFDPPDDAPARLQSWPKLQWVGATGVSRAWHEQSEPLGGVAARLHAYGTPLHGSGRRPIRPAAHGSV
jgi:hypothetical protein